jgi:hypothetical protein
MTITSAVTAAASGDNIIGHTVTAAVLGDGLSSIAVWALQLAHLVPPASVDQGITALSMIAASWILQKMAN